MATDTTTQQIVDVVTPAAGESVTEGTILEWHVKVGDEIKADETIVEISTDKVDVELPAPATGTVIELLVAEDDTVTVGQVIARIAVGGGTPAAGAPSGQREPDGEADGAPDGEADAAQQGAPTAGDGNGAKTAAPPPPAPPAAKPGEATSIVDVLTPAAGESVSEGTILEWHVEVGGAIKANDTIVEISTDKVDLELPSPASGTVTEILVAQGDTVTVGQVIARIAVAAGDGAPSDRGDGSGNETTAASSPPAEAATASTPAGVSPVAARVAAVEGVDLGAGAGSGRDGGITKADGLARAGGHGAATAP